MQKNACWVFETVQIILRIKESLIYFTEKVYGSSPYSPKYIYYTKRILFYINNLFNYLLLNNILL